MGFFLFLKAECWESCVQCFWKYSAENHKCFIYDYFVILMHSILSSLSSPMDNLGSSKDYLLFGRKWVDKIIGYFILFMNRLSNIKSDAQCTAHRAGTTSQEPQKPIHFNLQQLIPLPLFQELSQIPSSM